MTGRTISWFSNTYIGTLWPFLLLPPQGETHREPRLLGAAPWKRSKWDVALMVYVFICCTMAHSDLMPRFVREEYMKPYGLKALPVILVWFKLCYEIITKDYKPIAQKA